MLTTLTLFNWIVFYVINFNLNEHLLMYLHIHIYKMKIRNRFLAEMDSGSNLKFRISFPCSCCSHTLAFALATICALV